MIEKMLSGSWRQKGISLLEVVITVIAITIITSAVLPVEKIIIVQGKEEVLKNNLANVRQAINKFRNEKVRQKKDREKNVPGQKKEEVVDDLPDTQEDYPSSIDVLLEKRYLRRFEKEPFGKRWQYSPFTGPGVWHDFVLSYTDSPHIPGNISMQAQPGETIYDIRTSTDYTGLNNTTYKNW